MIQHARYRSGWILAVLTIYALGATSAAEDNLVKNGDFSQGQQHWDLGKDGHAQVVADGDGRSFVRVRLNHLRNAYIEQAIDLPPDALKVAVSARVRGPQIVPKGGWTGAFVMPRLVDEQDKHLSGSAGFMAIRTAQAEWKTETVTIDVPPTTRRMLLRAGLFETTGEYHVTDLQVRIVERGKRPFVFEIRKAATTGHKQPKLDPVDPVLGAPLDLTAPYDETLRVNPQDAGAFATIGDAIAQALAHREAGRSTRITIAPGIYRVACGELVIRDQLDQHGTAGIAIEAEQPGTVIIKGSDLFTAWREHEPGIYVHAWDKNWGFQRHWWASFNVKIGPVGLRRETMWVNGERQRQVLLEHDDQLVRAGKDGPQEQNSNTWMVRDTGGPRRPYSDVAPGTFYVDEDADLLVWRPQTGIDPIKATVEVSTKTYGFALSRVNNVLVRGLTFEHFANTFGLSTAYHDIRWNIDASGCALRLSNVQNVVLEDIVVRENNMAGLSVSDLNDVTIRRLDASDNGGQGIGGGGLVNVLFEDIHANRNNWRGHWGDFIGWHMAGIKLTQMDGVTYRNVTTTDNLACGFWFDVHAQFVHINRLISKGNLHAGAYMEMFQGPVQMVDATLENNGMGLILSGAANFTLQNSRIVGNGTQITLRNDFRHHPVHFRFEHNLIASRTDTLRDLEVKDSKAYDPNGNLRIPSYQYWVPDIAGFGVDSQPLFMLNTPSRPNGEPTSWQYFLETLQATGNTWYHPTLRHAFFDGDRWPIDFAAWTALTGETDATWRNPLGETTDWDQRSDAAGALTKPVVVRPPGLLDYTLELNPVWPEDGALRINAGAQEDWVDPHGKRWLADTHNTNGQLFTGVGPIDGKITRKKLVDTPTAAMTATGLAGIYASERYMLDGYLVAAPLGTYTVRLHFSENHAPVQAGNRTFAVVVNGMTVVERLDVVAEAGGQGQPVVKEIMGVKPEPFVAEDTRILSAGHIMIEFKRPPGSGEATMINAIEIIREETRQ